MNDRSVFSAMFTARTPNIIDISASTGSRPFDLAELWAYRELLYFLVWRNVKVRYKQTVLGAAWAIVQPLMTMVVFSLFLGKLAHVPSDGMPYPLFSFAALVPWTCFASALTNGTQSVIGDQLISKVYFPRVLVPLAATITPLVDFSIALATLGAMMAWYGVVPGAAIVWLPAFLALSVVAAFAASLWLSTLNVKFRDIRYIAPFVIQLWMFATPIAYPASIVPGRWRILYGLNPMTGVIEGFRWALVRGPRPALGLLLASAAIVVVLLVSGLRFFRRAEDTFADVI